MAHPDKLNHKTVSNAAIPYAPSQNPISGVPSLNAGADLIAVIDPLSNQGWFERRPGWHAALETTPTTFAAAPSRLFTWQKWDGTFYYMANVITGGNSLVYKLKVGTDNSFVILYTSTGSTTPFDFVVSNNFIYFSDGTNAQKWDGATLSKWGIAAPTMAIRGGFVGSTGSAWSFGVKATYCYGNSATGHLSAPATPSGSTGAVSNRGGYDFIWARSPDAQVDQIQLFRSADGGDGVFFLEDPTLSGGVFASNPVIGTIGQAVSNKASGNGPVTAGSLVTSGTYTGSTFPNYVIIIDANGTPNTFKWSNNGGASFNATGVAITGAAQTLTEGVKITFSATTGYTIGDRWDFASGVSSMPSAGDDTLLNTASKVTAPSNLNNPPPAMNGVASFANRIWGFKNDTVYFSGFEEIINGVDEECFPTNNTFKFGTAVQGIAPAGDGLLIFTEARTFKITGSSLDTFKRDSLFGRIGTRQRATLTPIGGSLAFLDSSGTIRITDGYSQSEISKNIRSDLTGITMSTTSMCFHTDGRRQFLLLLDGTNAKVRVYDMDLDLWMLPWTVGGGFIASLETSAGTWKLLLAHSSGKVMVNDFAHYTDNGSTYAPTGTLQLLQLTEDGHIADLEYVSVTSDATQPATVSYLVDEDPSTGSFTAITSNVKNPPLRSQGTNLIEKWYDARTPAALRASVKFTWANNSTNFKLYAFDLVSQTLQK